MLEIIDTGLYYVFIPVKRTPQGKEIKTMTSQIDFNTLKVVGEPASAGSTRVHFQDAQGNEVFKFGGWQSGNFKVGGNYHRVSGRTACPDCANHQDAPEDCGCNGFGVEIVEDLNRK